MRLVIFLVALLFAAPGSAEANSSAKAAGMAIAAPVVTSVVSDDIDRFWQAYDAIRGIDDQDKQVAILTRMFILPGTPGLHAFMEARGYTALGYVTAIRQAPLYWNSIRPRTYLARNALPGLVPGLERLRQLYPALRPASVYLTIGTLKSGGTTLGDKVLIGTEVMTGDSSVNVSEWPEARRAFFTKYYATDPIRDLDRLIVHEVVHTQQQGVPDTLSGRVIKEGSADFLAELATGRLPAQEYMTFGLSHDDAIRKAFARDMDSKELGFWLYAGSDNPFGVTDLGYYAGYAISKAFYERAKDKTVAIKRLVELNYSDTVVVEALVEESGWVR